MLKQHGSDPDSILDPELLRIRSGKNNSGFTTLPVLNERIFICLARFQSRGIWLEPEPSLWPGSGSTLKICLIIQANYMELNLI